MVATYTNARKFGAGNTDLQSWAPIRELLKVNFAGYVEGLRSGRKPDNTYIEYSWDEIDGNSVPTSPPDAERAVPEASVSPDILRNECQTFWGTASVGEQSQNVKSQAGDNTIEYQTMRVSKKIMQQMQRTFFDRQAGALATQTLGNRVSSVGNYIENTHGGTGGGFDTSNKRTRAITGPAAATDFTVEVVNDLVNDILEDGGDAKTLDLISTSRITSKVGQFDIKATSFQTASPKGGGYSRSDYVTEYVSQPGVVLRMVNNFLQDTATLGSKKGTDVFILDPRKLMKHKVWDWKVEALGKLGLSRERMISCNLTWSVGAPNRHAMIRYAEV